MPHFNPTKYDPRTDSSPSTEVHRQGAGSPQTVILDWTSIDPARRVCPCGCREELASSSRFRMGHDARLRGKLVRAHVTGTDVTIIKGRDVSTQSALAVAEQFSSPTLDWKTTLREAEGRYTGSRAKTDAANAEVLSRANGPQVGDRKLVKVGRWSYTGNLIAIYQDRDVAVFEYVTKTGEIKTIERPLEDVAAMADSDEVMA